VSLDLDAALLCGDTFGLLNTSFDPQTVMVFTLEIGMTATMLL
jgi:hypothetical protein